jgi:hypothetical protein
MASQAIGASSVLEPAGPRAINLKDEGNRALSDRAPQGMAGLSL